MPDTPAEELRQAAVRLVTKQPYQGVSDPLADLLYALADDMEEHEAVEGSASCKVHPRSFLFGLLDPRNDWTAALAVARVISGGGS